MAYTYDNGWTLRNWFEAQPEYQQWQAMQRWVNDPSRQGELFDYDPTGHGGTFRIGQDHYPTEQETLQQILSTPSLQTGEGPRGRYISNLFGIQDPLNNLDARVPDAFKGSLIPQGEDLAGMMLALAPVVAMAGGFAAPWGAAAEGAGTGAGAAGAGWEYGPMASAGVSDVPQGVVGTVSGGGAGAAGGVNLVYDAASGAFVPAGSAGAAGTATAGAGAGAGTGGLTLGQIAAGTPVSPFLGAASGGAGAAGGGSGLVYDAATGSLVPAASATGTAAGAAVTGAATGGAGASGGGLFGLTPMETLVGASTVGSLLQGGAALLGANTQANAANRATDAQMAIFNTLNAQGAPYRQAGYQALGTIMSPENQAYFTHQFGPADLQAGLAPGYEFMRDQGLRAATNAGNVGTGLAGNTRRGLIDYAENYALNQGYQPSFQNYQTQQTNIFNRLASIAGLGQTANAQSVSAGTGLGPSIGQNMVNAGTALGAGYVGAGNTLAGGLNNVASWYSLPAILAMGRG